MRTSAASSPTVRTAVAADQAFIARLGGAAFGDFDPRSREHTLALARAKGALAVVAELGGEPLGFAIIESMRDGSVLLQAIAVERRARGLGLGTELLKTVERLARARGYRLVRLCTAQANVEALELFLKHGFCIERRMALFYANGQDACALVKRLEPDAG